MLVPRGGGPSMNMNAMITRRIRTMTEKFAVPKDALYAPKEGVAPGMRRTKFRRQQRDRQLNWQLLLVGLAVIFVPTLAATLTPGGPPSRRTCVTGVLRLVTGGTDVRLTSNPRAQGSPTRTSSSSKDKYCEIGVQTAGKSNERNDSISNYLYLAEKVSENIHGRIKKSLFRHSAYWGKMQAYDSIQSVVRNGYSLQFEKYPLP